PRDNARKAETASPRGGGEFDGLPRAFPAVPDSRHELAVSCNNLGNLHRANKHPKEAEQDWRKALDLLTTLAAELPAVPIYRQELGRSQNELGIFLASTGRGDEAAKCWEQALELQTQLVKTYPGRPD